MNEELVKKAVSFTKKCGEVTMHTVVEADVIVPDSKPDIGRVLQVDADAVISGSEVQSDRVMVYGSVNFRIIYLSEGENPEIKSITAVSTYTDVGDIKGITPQMTVDAEADVENVEFKLLNGRKLAVKAVVETEAEVCTDAVEEIVTDVSGAVESKKSRISSVKVSPAHIKTFPVNERITIPSSHQSARDVLSVSTKLSDKTAKVINNKVIVKGELVITTLYTGAGNGEIASMCNTAQFTEILDVEGITEKNVSEIWLEVVKTEYSPEENGEGDVRTVNVQSEVLCKVIFFECETNEYISDFYSVDSRVCQTTEEKRIFSLAGKCSRQIALKGKVIPEADMPEIEKVYDISTRAYIDEVRQDGDSVTVKGHVDAFVLYISGDKDTPVYTAGRELEFEESFETNSEGCKVTADINVQSSGASYSFDGGTGAEIRCNVEFGGIFVRETIRNMLCDASFEPLDENTQLPSVTVCFVQDGDTLWDIAKKYYTTVGLIAEMNDIKDEKLSVGQQLYIPKGKS